MKGEVIFRTVAIFREIELGPFHLIGVCQVSYSLCDLAAHGPKRLPKSSPPECQGEGGLIHEIVWGIMALPIQRKISDTSA